MREQVRNDPRDFEVVAGGGVVVRGGDGLATEVALVHRPRYDDWSFPKGKLDAGEKLEDCALREVHEETGLVCELVDELVDVTYHDNQNRSKLVRYWLMSVVEGSFRANSEVDELRWVSLDEARSRLTYGHDLVVVDLLDAKA